MIVIKSTCTRGDKNWLKTVYVESWDVMIMRSTDNPLITAVEGFRSAFCVTSCMINIGTSRLIQKYSFEIKSRECTKEL